MLNLANLQPVLNTIPQTARQAPSPIMCRGTVLCRHSEINMYTILPDGAPPYASNALVAVDLSSHSTTGIGCLVEQSPLDIGTTVWYLDQPFLVWDGVSGNLWARPIIGADNTLPLPNTSIYPVWATIPSPDKELVYFTGSNDEVLKAFLGAGGITNPGDRSYGRPEDACNSDWLAVNAFKGYVRVSPDTVGIAGSPSCGLIFFTLDDMCVLTGGTTFIKDTAGAREAEYPDGFGGFTRVKSFAFTAGNAMGSLGKVADVLSGDPLTTAVTLKDDTSFPLWGFQEVAGNLVGGVLSTLAVPASDSGANTADTLPAPAITEHRGIDGAMRTSARHGVSISRGLGIDVLRQLEDEAGKLKEEEPEEPEEPLADITSDLSGELLDNADQYAGLMYELMKRRFVERYLKKADGTHWKAEAADRICQEVFSTEQETPLPELDENAPGYKFSDNLVETDDPILDGKKLRTHNRESFIYQSPTGGIVLSDGHGSEIRMEGGNITISCAGDIRWLPGRDMIGIVPRTLSLTSQDRMELTSDKKDVVICAGQALSLTAIKGTTTLESLSEVAASATDMQNRDKRADGGGVVIRSASTTAVVGKNLRLGLQEPDDKSTDGRKDPTGALTIDAGKGAAMLAGSSVYIHGTSLASLVGGEGGITAAGGSTIIAGASVGMATGQVQIGGEGVKGLKLTAPVFEEGKGLQGKDVNISVGDISQLEIKGNLLASDTIIGKTMVSNLTAANRMGCLNASGLSGIKMKEGVEPIWNKAKGMLSSTSTSISKAVSSGIDSLTAMTKGALFSAAGTKAGGVYYPTSEEYHCAEGHFWVPSRWQRLLDGGQTWDLEEKENALGEGDAQCPYPGKKAWKDDTGFIRTLEMQDPEGSASEKKLGPISKAYKVNATVK